MGQYEPNDSRNVTLKPNDGSTPEPARTGPRADTLRQQQQGQEKGGPGQKNQAHGGQEQVSYGNSRTERGRKESDMAKDRQQAGQRDEDDTLTSPGQAKVDANRPLGENG